MRLKRYFNGILFLAIRYPQKSENEMLDDVEITPEMANALGKAYSYLLERRKGRKVASIGVVELSPYSKTEAEYISRPIVEELDNL